MPITPEEMAQMQAQAGKDQGGEGKITALVKQVGDGLNQLSEMLNSSQATTDQDREQMAGILHNYIDLVEKKLGGAAPGQDPEEEGEPVQGPVPMAQGRGGVPMGPQGQGGVPIG